MRVEFARRAAADLDDIYDYTCEHWGIEQAERYLTAIRAAVQRLGSEAEMPLATANPALGRHRVRAGSHIIHYRRDDDSIVIDRILHERMDAKRHL